MSDVGEVSKAIAPIIDNLAKLTGPMCEEVGLYFGDKVRTFRQRNLHKIVDGSVARIESAGKPVNPVPPRLLLPIVEAASLEDNPTLQEMWSGLLAKASEDTDNMSPSYAETLKVLTPNEAKALKVLYEFTVGAPAQSLGTQKDVHYRLTCGLCFETGVSIAPVLLLETLERLGLIRREYDLLQNEPPPYLQLSQALYRLPGGVSFIDQQPGSFDDRSFPELTYELAFTSYGVQFMRACVGDLLESIPVSAPSAQESSTE